MFDLLLSLMLSDSEQCGNEGDQGPSDDDVMKPIRPHRDEEKAAQNKAKES
jgi:hypothetical protein